MWGAYGSAEDAQKLNPPRWGSAVNFKYLNRCNSVADRLISLHFFTEFDYMTSDDTRCITNVQDQRSRSQHLPSYDHQIIAHFFRKSGSLNLMTMSEFL